MKIISLFLTVLCIMLSSAVQAGPATAVQAPALTASNIIGIFDEQRIFAESAVGKSVQQQINKMQATYQNEVNKQAEEVRKKKEELAKQRSVIAPEVFEQKVGEFNNHLAELQRGDQLRRAELEKAFGESMGEMKKVVLDIITSIANQRGFIVVMPSVHVVYAQKPCDITDDIIAALDKRLTSIPIKIPADSKKK